MNSDFPASKNRLGCIFVEKFRYRCSFDPVGSSSTPPPSPPHRDPAVSKNSSETFFEKIQISMFLWPLGVIQYTSALPHPPRPRCIEKLFRNIFRENSDIDVPLTPWGHPVHLRPPPPHTRPHCIEKPFRNTFGENSDTDVLLTWHKHTHTHKLFFFTGPSFQSREYIFIGGRLIQTYSYILVQFTRSNKDRST